MTATRNVLISGAGVAGSTLAYWLARNGFKPTVVERSQGLCRAAAVNSLSVSSAYSAIGRNAVPVVRSRSVHGAGSPPGGMAWQA